MSWRVTGAESGELLPDPVPWGGCRLPGAAQRAVLCRQSAAGGAPAWAWAPGTSGRQGSGVPESRRHH